MGRHFEVLTLHMICLGFSSWVMVSRMNFAYDNGRSHLCYIGLNQVHICSYWSAPSTSSPKSASNRSVEIQYYPAWIWRPFLSGWTSADRWWTLFPWQLETWTRTCFHHFGFPDQSLPDLVLLHHEFLHRLWNNQFAEAYFLDLKVWTAHEDSKQLCSTPQQYLCMRTLRV